MLFLVAGFLLVMVDGGGGPPEVEGGGISDTCCIGGGEAVTDEFISDVEIELLRYAVGCEWRWFDGGGGLFPLVILDMLRLMGGGGGKPPLAAGMRIALVGEAVCALAGGGGGVVGVLEVDA